MPTVTTKPAHNWLPRFSLLTLIVVVNLAGVLIGVNSLERRMPVSSNSDYFDTCYGWPLVYWNVAEMSKPDYILLALNTLFPVIVVAFLTEGLLGWLRRRSANRRASAEGRLKRPI